MQPMPPSVGASLWIFPTYAGTGLRRRSSMLPADGIPVARLMLFEQAVANQQPDTTLTNLDRRDHGHAP